MSKKKSVMYENRLSFVLRKSGTFQIQNGDFKLACIRTQSDGDHRDGALIVWVNNSHPLFESEEATGWIVNPVSNDILNQSISSSYTVEESHVFLEMHEAEDDSRSEDLVEVDRP